MSSPAGAAAESGWPGHILGQPHRPPLLFLHGFMGSAADWLPIARALAADHFCLLPDLPGHGQRPPLAPLTFDTVVDDLMRLLAARQIDGVNLVGYSMGGRLALYAALKYPARVRSLLLEGASPGLSAPAERTARAALDDQRAAQLTAQGIAAFVDDWYTAPLFASLARQPALLAETKTRRKKNRADWLANAISALSPGRQPPLWDRLPELQMPTLLLAGALDTKYAAVCRKMAARIPQAQIAIAPQAGHNVHLEQPAAFIELAQRFLA